MSILCLHFTWIIFEILFKMTTILFLFQGHLSEGTKVLYDYLHKEPKMTMILGPFDNDLAKTVAAYAGLPDIGLLQVRIYFNHATSVASSRKQLSNGSLHESK